VYAYVRLRDGTVWNQVHVYDDAEIALLPELKAYEGAYAWISPGHHLASDGGKRAGVGMKTYLFDRKEDKSKELDVVSGAAGDVTFIADLKAGRYVNLTETEFKSGVHPK